MRPDGTRVDPTGNWIANFSPNRIECHHFGLCPVIRLLTKTAAIRPFLSRISGVCLDQQTNQGNLHDQKQFLPAISFDDNEVIIEELWQGPGAFLGAFFVLAGPRA